MKILQVSNRIPYPLNEGGTIGIYNYTRGFHEAGCEVTLITLHAKKHQINLTEARVELEKFCRFMVFEINTDVTAWGAFSNLFTNKSYNVQRFYSEKFKAALIDLLESEDFDVIQIEGTFPALYTDVINSRKKKAKVILRQHNVEHQIWERMSENASNPLKKWYFGLLSSRLKKFEQDHLNQYDAIVPVTQDDGDLFRSLGSTIPIFPSPAGIDTDLWNPGEAQSNPLFIYHIGSLEWMPNLEAVNWFLEEVWPIIYGANPLVRFYVAGKGMPDEMSQMNIPGVIMAGQVKDAVQFISDKAISVVPLKSGSGIRLKILEAMSAGKCVVSTTVGAQGIQYQNGSDILIADTAKDFADTVLQLVEDTSLQKKLAENARNNILQNYSNQSVIDKLLEFYSKLEL